MPSPARVRLPLTAAQEGVWIGQRLDPASSLYNAAEYVEIEGTPDLELFERALRQTVAEADAVHVRFVADAGGVMQELRQPQDWALPIIELPDLPAALAWMRDDLTRLVDLERGPLFAHALLVLGTGGVLWHHRAHHIALDGYGFSLIARRVAAIYTALAGDDDAGGGRPFGPLRPVVDDDRAYRDSSRHGDDRSFWHSRFADHPAVVGLSERMSVPRGHALRRGGTLPRDAMAGWRAVADESATTWAQVVLALVARYVRRETGAGEVILGLPVMGRLGSAAARTPAMVVNIVPLRLPIADDAPLSETVRTVTRELELIRPHQRYAGERLRRELGLVGAGRRLHGPVVNVMPFDYSLRFGPHRALARNLSAGAQFVEDMAIHVHARFDGEPLSVDIDANPDSYSPSELALHLRGLTDLLADPRGRALEAVLA